MEELLASSYMFVYVCLYLICIFLYILFASSYINTSYVCLLRFLLALNFVFSKTNMLNLLLILFVIKQLLGSLISDIDIYAAKLSIIRLGKAKWW